METNVTKKIDWEERWFEVFKAAITGAMAAAPEHKNNFSSDNVANGIVGMAIKIADKSIACLNPEENKSDEA